MPEEARLKCVECTRRGRPCVDMSWESVDRSREKAKLEVKSEEQTVFALVRRLSEAQARLARKRRILEQAQQRSTEQMHCLVREMEAGGEDLTRRSIPDALEATAIEAELFPEGLPDWDPSLFGDPPAASSQPAGAGGSGSSSQGS